MTNEQLLQVVRDALIHLKLHRHVTIAEKAESAIAELEARLRWIPVSERLPKRGQPVVATVEMNSGHWFGCCTYQGYFPWIKYPDGSSVTHWIPLPQPPAGEQE